MWINSHGASEVNADTLLFGGHDAIAVEHDGTTTHWSQKGQPGMPHRPVSKWMISSHSDAMGIASKLAVYIDYRPMPTQAQVVDAFDSFGYQMVQHVALQDRLRQEGFDAAMVAQALTMAVKAGALTLDPLGSLRRT
ncbi:hypothetical protein WK47_25210 [Burkholderia ubonensis]|nr:hypothetical protein WJ74_11320 [Burkholderia ubonensis]KVT01176.1 hypothetical protein WK47_25210 [Burkholderia ubonensis]KVT07392.1 hypothetical protein WK46_10700 [Burkholderia ubonensis]KVT33831.1 hypothetical protein WK50_02585 [Burkholderia ubonensis]